jgi:hypothetical protein
MQHNNGPVVFRSISHRTKSVKIVVQRYTVVVISKLKLTRHYDLRLHVPWYVQFV